MNQTKQLRLLKGKSVSTWLCQLALLLGLFSFSFGMIEMVAHTPSITTTELVVSANRVHKPRIYKIVKSAKVVENLICPQTVFNKLAILHKSGIDKTAFDNLETKRLICKSIIDYSLVKLNTIPPKETPNFIHQG